MKETMTKITCPYCKREIPLDEALTHQIKEHFQKEFNEQLSRKEKELKAKEDAVVKKEKELQKLKEEQANEIEKIQEKLEKDFTIKLSVEKKKTEESIKKKIIEEAAGEMKALQEELSEKTDKIKEFKNLELKLRQEKRKLEEDKQNLELEVTRKLDAEREKLKEEVEKKVNEQHRFKDLEKEKLIDTMKDQIEELKRKAKQGSQQLQGEVLEIELEELLTNSFRNDKITPVPKGMRGADVIQKVCTPSGQQCGSIIWESKRTKAWSDSWIGKLKEDQREAKADIAAIVSTTLRRAMEKIWSKREKQIERVVKNTSRMY